MNSELDYIVGRARTKEDRGQVIWNIYATYTCLFVIPTDRRHLKWANSFTYE